MTSTASTLRPGDEILLPAYFRNPLRITHVERRSWLVEDDDFVFVTAIANEDGRRLVRLLPFGPDAEIEVRS